MFLFAPKFLGGFGLKKFKHVAQKLRFPKRDGKFKKRLENETGNVLRHFWKFRKFQKTFRVIFINPEYTLKKNNLICESNF